MSTAVVRGGLPATADRLMTTFFLAAVLHAILILGVTFSAPVEHGDGDETHGMEVILVDQQAPSVAHNAAAPYLAQRSQQGSGNSSTSEQTLIPKSAPMTVMQAGSDNGAGSGDAPESGAMLGEEARVASTAPAPRIVYLGTVSSAEAAAPQQLTLSTLPTLGVSANEEGVELRVRGATKQALWVTADTRASDIAVYLDHWRHKIERIGTLNFPNVAKRQKYSGTPVIAVVIDSRGKLAEASIRRTSGHRELDDAALRILKLSAPFDPFPAELGATHDRLRIAYEWQFLGGAFASSAVAVVESP